MKPTQREAMLKIGITADNVCCLFVCFFIEYDYGFIQKSINARSHHILYPSRKMREEREAEKEKPGEKTSQPQEVSF